MPSVQRGSFDKMELCLCCAVPSASVLVQQPGRMMSFLMLLGGFSTDRPAHLVQVGLHLLQRPAQVAPGHEAQRGHFDEDRLHPGRDHALQQGCLGLVPHVGQRGQAQPRTHLHPNTPG